MSIDWLKIEKKLNPIMGITLNLKNPRTIGGGCINQSYRVDSDNGPLFIKLNNVSQLVMFQAEYEGLNEIAKSTTVKVPEPLAVGTSGQLSYLLLEFLHLDGINSSSASLLGSQLADMHRHTSKQFGWHRDNTIGSTPQINSSSDGWIDFYRRHRLGFQLGLADKNGASHALLAKGERLMEKLDAFFQSYQPQPSLLHGDLWGGNASADRAGHPVILDPAVYFGDRESDIAMTELFGGFSAAFYDAYNEAWPLDSGYTVRKTLYNLYHILNHFNLFGGGYASQAERMTDQLLANIKS